MHNIKLPTKKSSNDNFTLELPSPSPTRHSKSSSPAVSARQSKIFKPKDTTKMLLSLRNLSQVDRLKFIFEKPTRDDQEARFIYQSLQDLAFFRNIKSNNTEITEDVMLQICKDMVLEHHPAGSIVIKEGDPSNGKVYIVLTGEVFVVVKECDPYMQENIEKIAMKGLTHSSTSDSLSYIRTPKNQQQQQQQQHQTQGTADVKQSSKNFLLQSRTFHKVSDSPSGTPKNASDFEAAMQKSKINRITSNMNLTPRRLEILQNDLMSNYQQSKGGYDTKTKSLWNKIAPAVLISGQMNARKKKERLLQSTQSLKLIRKGSSKDEDNPSPKFKHSQSNQTNILTSKTDASSAGGEKQAQGGFTFQLQTLQQSNSLKSEGGIKLEPQTSLEVDAFEERPKEDEDDQSEPSSGDEIGGISAYTMAQKYGAIRDKIFKGSHFGEMALNSNTARTATVITNTDCQLLVIQADDYRKTMGKFESKIKAVVQIMQDFFPKIESLASLKIKESLVYLFEEVPLKVNQHPIGEGEEGNYFYIICSGVCEISKKLLIRATDKKGKQSKHFRNKSTRQETIQIATVSRGAFIGEDILTNEQGKYEFSVKVVSENALLYKIHRGKFRTRFPIDIIKAVKDEYEIKKEQYSKIFEDKGSFVTRALQNKNSNMALIMRMIDPKSGIKFGVDKNQNGATVAAATSGNGIITTPTSTNSNNNANQIPTLTNGSAPTSNQNLLLPPDPEIAQSLSRQSSMKRSKKRNPSSLSLAIPIDRNGDTSEPLESQNYKDSLSSIDGDGEDHILENNNINGPAGMKEDENFRSREHPQIFANLSDKEYTKELSKFESKLRFQAGEAGQLRDIDDFLRKAVKDKHQFAKIRSENLKVSPNKNQLIKQKLSVPKQNIMDVRSFKFDFGRKAGWSMHHSPNVLRAQTAKNTYRTKIISNKYMELVKKKEEIAYTEKPAKDTDQQALDYFNDTPMVASTRPTTRSQSSEKASSIIKPSMKSYGEKKREKWLRKITKITSQNQNSAAAANGGGTINTPPEQNKMQNNNSCNIRITTSSNQHYEQQSRFAMTDRIHRTTTFDTENSEAVNKNLPEQQGTTEGLKIRDFDLVLKSSNKGLSAFRNTTSDSSQGRIINSASQSKFNRQTAYDKFSPTKPRNSEISVPDKYKMFINFYAGIEAESLYEAQANTTAKSHRPKTTQSIDAGSFSRSQLRSSKAERLMTCE